MFDKIYKLRFKNFKCFTCSDFEEIDFSKPLNLLIGKNNSGKSSILDLLRYVYLHNNDEDRYKLHELIENGTELQLGYVLHGDNTDCLKLSEDINLAWCRAVTHAEYLELLLAPGIFSH